MPFLPVEYRECGFSYQSPFLRHIQSCPFFTRPFACYTQSSSQQYHSHPGRPIQRVTFDAHAFNWALQEGEAAGQTVEHLHLHLLPRYQEDLPNPGDWYPKLEEHMASQHLDSGERPKLTKEQQQDIVDKLRQEAQKKFGHYYLRDFSK
ncbi:MAG: hypothetical protein BRD50_00390 [Bacteroidetes bacterium SW_11_45_7]|nr:MAG: hypothetical protein BRD50_00390 [Bacteroidetes bacterium SW_11_45_7]